MLPTALIRSFSSISRIPFAGFRRTIATYPTDSKEEMTITDDGGVIVCWHPEKPFPYEFSKPLPLEEKPESRTVLKLDNKEEMYKIFRNKKEEFIREELMKITFTNKHRWFPRSRDRKAKKTKPNRPYL